MDEIILGVDPGSRTTGYAVLKVSGSKNQVLACDVIRLAKIGEHTERLRILFENMNSIISAYKPTACAVETPVYGKDPLAMLKLGRAQSAIMLAAITRDVPVTEYYPKAIKKSITGNGNAAKEQVAYMLKRLLNFEDDKIPNDATDALAIAWCHMMKGGSAIQQPKKKMHQNNKVSSWEEFVRANEERVR